MIDQKGELILAAGIDQKLVFELVSIRNRVSDKVEAFFGEREPHSMTGRRFFLLKKFDERRIDAMAHMVMTQRRIWRRITPLLASLLGKRIWFHRSLKCN